MTATIRRFLTVGLSLSLPLAATLTVSGDCFDQCMADPDMGFMLDCKLVRNLDAYCEPLIYSASLDEGRHRNIGPNYIEHVWDNVNEGEGTRPGIQPQILIRTTYTSYRAKGTGLYRQSALSHDGELVVQWRPEGQQWQEIPVIFAHRRLHRLHGSYGRTVTEYWLIQTDITLSSDLPKPDDRPNILVVWRGTKRHLGESWFSITGQWWLADGEHQPSDDDPWPPAPADETSIDLVTE